MAPGLRHESGCGWLASYCLRPLVTGEACVWECFKTHIIKTSKKVKY